MSCDKLSILYLRGSKNIMVSLNRAAAPVVISFQFCILGAVKTSKSSANASALQL